MKQVSNNLDIAVMDHVVRTPEQYLVSWTAAIRLCFSPDLQTKRWNARLTAYI